MIKYCWEQVKVVVVLLNTVSEWDNWTDHAITSADIELSIAHN